MAWHRQWDLTGKLHPATGLIAGLVVGVITGAVTRDIYWGASVGLGTSLIFRAVPQFRSRRGAGLLLLDLGPLPGQPAAWTRWCMAAAFALLGLWRLVAADERHLSAGAFYLILALSPLMDLADRRQIRRNGISYYGSLIRWEQIESYAWERSEPRARDEAESETLCLVARLSQDFLVQEPNQPVSVSICVPARQKESVERLLASHVPRGTGGAGSIG